jgi:hypothetical protein
MNWANVVFKLGKMHGKSLVAADTHHDPFYQKQHRDRAALSATMQEALMAGLSEAEMSELVEMNANDTPGE